MARKRDLQQVNAALTGKKFDVVSPTDRSVGIPLHHQRLERQRWVRLELRKPVNVASSCWRSRLRVNIAGQYLQTNREIGYVVIDVEAAYSRSILQTLKQIPGTIKTRLLF